MNDKSEDIESEESEGVSRTDVVRVTVVMPAVMYTRLKLDANEKYQLVGEYLRDVIREHFDTEDSHVTCEDKDCGMTCDGRLAYCPYCGTEIPEEEEEE